MGGAVDVRHDVHCALRHDRLDPGGDCDLIHGLVAKTQRGDQLDIEQTSGVVERIGRFAHSHTGHAQASEKAAAHGHDDDDGNEAAQRRFDGAPYLFPVDGGHRLPLHSGGIGRMRVDLDGGSSPFTHRDHAVCDLCKGKVVGDDSHRLPGLVAGILQKLEN